MDEFERRLAESLRSRAEDAEPTPVLWTEVRDRFSRRRWLTWTYALAGAAAVIVLAVVVVPGVWDALRGPDRLDILDEPPPDELPVPGIPGDVILASTDGVEVVVHVPWGDDEPVRVGEVEDGERIEAVAIRPGSTVDDVELVYLVRDAHGGFSVVAGRIAGDGGERVVEAIPLGGTAQPGGVDVPPVPVWSPDGVHLAWMQVATTDGPASPEIVAVTWDPDVPLTEQGPEGTPMPEARDRAVFSLGEIPPGTARLGVWRWHELERDAGAEGTIVVHAGFEAWEVPVHRADDGSLATGGPRAVDRGAAHLLATADGGPDLARFAVVAGEVPVGPTYELLLDEDDRGAPRVSLREQRWPDETDDITLSDAAWEAIGADPQATWLRAGGDRVVLGTAEGVWLFDRIGRPRATGSERLDGVTHADVHLLPAEPPPPVEPTPEVTEEPDADQTYPDVAILATDGSEIFVIPPGLAHDEAAREPLATLPSGHHAVAVAVRPGSTTTDLDAVVWVRVDDGHELHRLRYAGANAQLEPLPEPYQISDDVAPGSRPRPVWSPDGAYLAWTELPADETASGPRLRTIGWDDGPGTGDTATDNAAFELDDLPLTTVRAEVWTGSAGGDECPAADTLTLRLTSEQLEAWTVRMEVQADGALSLPADATELVLDDPYGTPVAYALDERVCEGMFAPYGLYAADADEDGEFDLFVHDPIGHQGFPVPEQVRTAELPALGEPRDGEGAPWITGLGDVVIVGVDGEAWLTGRPLPEFEERPVRIDGTVVHAEPIG